MNCTYVRLFLPEAVLLVINCPHILNCFDLSLLVFVFLYIFGLLQVFSQSNLTLKELKMVEVCEIESLKHIASSKRQMQFLQVLSRSQQFIEWLQKKAKGKCKHITYICTYKHWQ